MIDRPLRPLFPEGYACETQVIGLLLSADLENDSDTLAIIGASTALVISDIPFDRPVGAVRVGYWDGAFVINPATADLKAKSQLNLLVAGTEDAIVMVEASAHEVTEDVLAGALVEGHNVIKQIVALQRDLRARVGKPKRPFAKKEVDPAIVAEIEGALAEPLLAAARIKGKIESYAQMKKVKDAYVASIPEDQPEKKAAFASVYDGLREKLLKREIFVNGHRLDGRRFDEVRAITCEVGVLPRTHGSALFTRGETQALVTATLGTSEDSQIIDTVQEAEYRKRFMLHYNFPPFSVGEVKFLRGPGRREIGHGVLAERSLREMLPAEEGFPYTIRIVSDILESNGSSSMATVCGGTLALMDAGVPIKSPVAGVAMGLVMDGDRHQVLTDIAGEEDHYGDMDFKVAGTRAGITALQMDIKVGGVSPGLMVGALEQARVGRLHILDKMLEALAQPRTDISPYAPRILTIRVPVDKIRDIIGPGGKMIRSIVERHHRGAHRHPGAQQELPRQGGARRRVRRLRRDPARDGRPAARLGDGPPPRQQRARRGEGGRPGAGQGREHRSLREDPALPQGAARGGGGRRPRGRLGRGGRERLAGPGRRSRPRPRARPRPRRRRARSRPEAGRRSRWSWRPSPRPRSRAVGR